jgi:hypothetical protein
MYTVTPGVPSDAAAEAAGRGGAATHPAIIIQTTGTIAKTLPRILRDPAYGNMGPQAVD